MIFRAAGFHELDAATLYAILKLRADVFVVEQQSAYADLDGRDTEAATRHLWFEKDRLPVAYLRILDSGGPLAGIGRVVTAKDARGMGLANQLMAAALAVVGEHAVTLDAQSNVVGLYERYGFKPSGPEYVEDGIPHVPMRREGAGG